MSFGFSLGDFLTAGELIFKVSCMLREAGGSAHQYKRVDLDLNSLKLALIEVDKLVPPPELEATAAAIKATALSCKLPLREFLKSVKGYQRSLGVGQTAGIIKDVEQKIRWATKEEAVTKLRGELVGYVGSVNMLLGLYQM
jgi:hypothetical protein